MATGIDWTDETWNPVTGCSKVSTGCDHCYAETLSLRYGWSKKPWTPEHAAANVVLHPERLRKPFSWREPRMVFVNSMSDLFHENIPYEFIRDVFNVMRSCDGGTVAATGKTDPAHTFQVLTKRPHRALELWRDRKLGFTNWPDNVWIGVSIESWGFNWRADALRQIQAPIRFISAEPLLDTLYGRRPLDLDGISWVIAGGESGPGFRPMNLDHARELRDHCLDQDVAFFLKQIGGIRPKSGGKTLDGREWCQYPETNLLPA